MNITKRLVIAGILMTTLATYTHAQQDAAGEATTTAATEPQKTELEEIKSAIATLQATLNKLVGDMNNRTQEADNRLKKIEDAIGVDGFNRFGGISRQLEDMSRNIDEIERKVNQIDRDR